MSIERTSVGEHPLFSEGIQDELELFTSPLETQTSSIEVSPRHESTYDSDYTSKKDVEKWIRAVVEDDQVLLSKTGFNVAANLAQYIQMNRSGNREGYFSITKNDVIGHTLEFSLGEPVIPYDVHIASDNSRPVVLTRDYVTNEYVPLLSLLNPHERCGAVVRRTELLANLLHKAQPGDFFVTTSPDGWHGLTNDESVAYTEYNHTQTGIYEVLEDKTIRAYTVRSSMTLDQNEEFLRRASNGNYMNKDTSHIDRIIDVVDTVVASPSVHSLSDVLTLIGDIRGDEVFWQNIKYTGEHIKDWYYSEVAQRRAYADSLRNIDTDIAVVLNQFWNNVQTTVHGESIDEMRLLAHYVRDAVLQSSFVVRSKFSEKKVTYSVATETAYNEGQSGCVSYVQSEFGQRTVSSELGINYEFNIEGRCRSRRKCLSGNEGYDKMLAVCKFCLNCDIGIRTGKLSVSDILAQVDDETNFNINGQREDVTPENDVLVVSIGKLIASLFVN